MDQRMILGIVAIGGGLLWYMSSQSASTLPDATTTSTTTTSGTGTGTGSGGSTDDDSTDDTDTTEGSDDASTVDSTDCSKYRKSHHEQKKVWMNSSKEKTWGNWATDFSPTGVRMEDFETHKEQYFVNDEVEWELDLSVRNHSDANCDKGWMDVTNTCWFAPYSSWSAGGNDGNHLYCKVIWEDPQGNTYEDDSGVITRHTKWSNLNGKFRVPNATASIGVWKVSIEYGWKKSSQSVSWDGGVFRVVPESCADASSAAETYKSEFSRPIFAPAISHQSFMQF